MTELRRDPDFLRYYAAVLTREADARAPSEFSDWLMGCADRALREADNPVQLDLFAIASRKAA